MHNSKNLFPGRALNKPSALSAKPSRWRKPEIRPRYNTIAQHRIAGGSTIAPNSVTSAPVAPISRPIKVKYFRLAGKRAISPFSFHRTGTMVRNRNAVQKQATPSLKKDA